MRGEDKIAEGAGLGRQSVVRSNDRFALEGVEKFGGVKTEDLEVTEVADHASLVRAPKGMGRIEQQRRSVSRSDLGELFHFARQSPQVHSDDARRTRRDPSLDLVWIDIVGMQVHVTEYRCEIQPLERMSRGDERKGRHDPFPAEAKSPDRDLQAYVAIAGRYTMFHSHQLSYPLLHPFTPCTLLSHQPSP